jgi:hypothetical protein
MERAGLACDCCAKMLGSEDRGTYVIYELLCKRCLEYHRRKRFAGQKTE